MGGTYHHAFSLLAENTTQNSNITFYREMFILIFSPKRMNNVFSPQERLKLNEHFLIGTRFVFPGQSVEKLWHSSGIFVRWGEIGYHLGIRVSRLVESADSGPKLTRRVRTTRLSGK